MKHTDRSEHPAWLRLLIGCFLTAGLIGGGMISCRQVRPRPISQSRFLLDTFVEITVVCRNSRHAEDAIAAAYQEIERIEKRLSRYQPDSQISVINQHAGEDKAVQVDREVAGIVRRALTYADATRGLFDVTLGPVIDLWGIGTDHERVPEAGEVQTALRKVAYQAVSVQEQQVRLHKAGMIIDLGGIAKGYAIDRAMAVLQQHDLQHVLINAGGDIRGIGKRADGTPWRIGIQHPRESGIMGVVELQHAAIVTSGDYERFFEREQTRYHHIFDPQTGMPARGCQSVTTVAPTAEAADVFATAVFVMGPEQGLAFIENRVELEGMIIGADGTILTSSGFSYTETR